MADLAGFALLLLVIALAVRGWWRRARVRVVFARQGEHAGRVALVWFRSRWSGWGGRLVWLWLPASLSARLWRVRASGRGRFARWLRRASDQ